MKKRGQITLFIILGIVLLSTISIILYIRSTTVRERLTPELIPAISQIPAEARPVRTYTEDCIYKLSEEAFRKIGFGGGYIEDAGIITDPITPTESDGVEYPGSDLKIPYWWYLKSDNKCAGNCEFSSLQPPLSRTQNSIETQVDN